MENSEGSENLYSVVFMIMNYVLKTHDSGPGSAIY